MVHLEVDDNFCFSLQVVFRYSRLRVLRSTCAAGRRSQAFTRCLHVRLFTLARVLSCSLEVMVLTCFLREVVPDGSSVVARAGYRTSQPCVNAVDGTSFPRTVARTLMKRRIIALPGRSQTARRSHTPLASGQRGHGHGTARSFFPCPAWVV